MALNRQKALTTTAMAGGQGNALSMWVRQEILARHTNQDEDMAGYRITPVLVFWT
jgi:hypothetical protein